MAEGEKEMKLETLYRDNEIDGFRMGALFDLRVRFAFEMLTQGGAAALIDGMPISMTAEERGQLAARAALAATSELVKLAEGRGLVTAFPEGGQVSTTMKRHAPRLAAWAVEQHVAGQRAQADMAGRIATPPGTAPILPSGNSGHQH